MVPLNEEGEMIKSLMIRPASQPEYQTDRQSSKNRVVSQLLLSDTCKRELGSPSPSLSQAQVR